MSEVTGPLSCSFYAKINKPIAEVFAAVQTGSKLNKYFATGPEPKDLVEGTTVHWGFHDFPDAGPFPVQVVEVVANERIHLKWESGIENGWNDVEMTFESLDNPDQTLVRITETGWPASNAGVEKCSGNCGGWSNMMACLKVYLELGVNLREFMF